MIDVEICCNSIASAVAAKEGCADRIELCRDLECGGLTPSDEAIAYCSRHLGLRTHVLVRPRPGNFCYTEFEQMEMIATIKRCKELGAAAVVLGLLTEDGKVDVEVTRRLVQLAAPMEVTFHRAFDEAQQDPQEALWAVAAARCDRLRQLVAETGVREVHRSCKKTLDDGTLVTDAATVRQLIDQTLTL